MTDKAPINVTEWSPEHIRKYLEKHMKSSHFKEDAINKLLGQDVDGWLFLKLTEEKLTRKNGPYELKPGPAERIIELVERLKEKQGQFVNTITDFLVSYPYSVAFNNRIEIPPASVEVITATEFEKFRENNKRQLEKLNKMMNTVITDINHLSSDVNTTKEDIKGINGRLMIQRPTQ